MPKIKPITFNIIFFAISAALLTLIQVPHGLGFLAWFAWVPFVYTCKPGESGYRLGFCSYAVAAAYWLINLWWLSLVTVPGYFAFCLYLALYWPIIALLIRYFRRINFPMTIAVPLLILGAEALQGILFTGFRWRFLSHSQYDNLPLIQIAEIFGATGVSFIIALANGLIADLIIDYRTKRVFRKINFIKTAAVILVIAAALIYGFRRITQIDSETTKGPLIAAVQPNIPSYVKEEADNAELILDDLLAKSNQAFDAGAELVIWPETIVLATMNQSFLKIIKSAEPNSLPEQFDQIISKHAENRGYILFGAHSAILEPDPLRTKYVVKSRYNSAFMYRPDGKQSASRFDKIHLVPFGEYMPFKESAPLIYNFFQYFNPYDYDYTLSKGENYTVFNIKTEENDYNFGTIICYEDTDPEVTRKMAVDKDGNKKIDWLVNISNDGWYVKWDKKNKKVIPSGELSQRTAISVFRAVENRTSIIRSVNTGISCAIDPAGRIIDGYAAGNLPEKAMERQAVEGWFADNIKINNRVTFFSKYGNWPDTIFAAAFIFILILPFINRIKRKRNLETHVKD